MVAPRWAAAGTILTQIADRVPYVRMYAEDEAHTLGKGLAFGKPGIASFDLSDGGCVFSPKPTA
ncbi:MULTISPECIES: hypothetical protein [Streptomyces]|jgi:hypothetical protein|uniref:Uncharacterized protein n=1 Tax=Streptomyces sp. 900129855 TaxID=3155129 RepID=A0ABV2ZXS2_9ACTN